MRACSFYDLQWGVIDSLYTSTLHSRATSSEAGVRWRDASTFPELGHEFCEGSGTLAMGHFQPLGGVDVQPLVASVVMVPKTAMGFGGGAEV
jgi:hypothetical protein